MNKSLSHAQSSRVTTERHLTLLLLISTSVLTSLPWLYALYGTLQQDKFLFPSFSGDETHYLSRAKQYWLGEHPTKLVSPSLTRDGFGNSAERIFYFLSKILGNGNYSFAITSSLIAITSTLAAIFTFYFLLRKLEISRILASCGCFFVAVFADLFPDKIFSLNSLTSSLLIARWPAPSVHFALINMMIILLLSAKNRLRYILLSVILASGFYLYFYTWQIMLALIFVKLVIDAFAKQSQEFRGLFASTIFGILLAFPIISELNSQLNKTLKSNDSFFIFTNGYVQIRTFHLTKITLFLGFFIIALLFFRSKVFFSVRQKNFIHLVFFASVVIQGQSLLTGKEVQPGHYYWYFEKPYAALVFFLLTTRLLLKSTFLLSILFTMINVVILFVDLSQTKSQFVYAENLPSLSFIQQMGAHSFTFDEELSAYWQVNASSSPLPIAHMVYYPSSERYSLRFCAMHNLWNERSWDSFETSGGRVCPIQNELLAFYGDFPSFRAQIDSIIKDDSSAFIKSWFNEYGLERVISLSPFSHQQKVILSQGGLFRLETIEGLYVASK